VGVHRHREVAAEPVERAAVVAADDSPVGPQEEPAEAEGVAEREVRAARLRLAGRPDPVRSRGGPPVAAAASTRRSTFG
jgi:hypothetical protein